MNESAIYQSGELPDTTGDRNMNDGNSGDQSAKSTGNNPNVSTQNRATANNNVVEAIFQEIRIDKHVEGKYYS